MALALGRAGLLGRGGGFLGGYALGLRGGGGRDLGLGCLRCRGGLGLLLLFHQGGDLAVLLRQRGALLLFDQLIGRNGGLFRRDGALGLLALAPSVVLVALTACSLPYSGWRRPR